jgi:hypothetical protein
MAAVGIPQGSPLLPILYLFYNAHLLEAVADRDIQMRTNWTYARLTEARGHISNEAQISAIPMTY